MNSVIFNIPIRLVDLYAGKDLIVRAKDASEFAQRLGPADIETLQYVQLTDLGTPTESLTTWGEGVPVDLLLSSPSTEFTQLYNFSALQHKHPVRATIPVRPGFAKAVKAAFALKFSIKIDISQPDAQLIDELAEVLELFLHRSTVTQSVEFFHSIFLSFYHREPANMWRIQEEDPDLFCYVNDDGLEVSSRRIASAIGYQPAKQPNIKGAVEIQRSATNECDGCAFADRCRGYFKLPDPDYDCRGVKTLFASLRSAAEELRGDLKSYSVSQGGEPV